ncbi:FAD-binding oxidoreductase, partial [Listeria monocytogenes]
MGPITDKVATAESLPQETRIAIIGGGVIGVSTALFLAERGIPVPLFEKGEIAGEQSSRNWGWCRRT